MSEERIVFSPVTRLSGLLSAEVILKDHRIVEANVISTMFRGYEWIMRDRHITDAVYLTQRVCGICSLAHGAVSSYLVDDIYDNDVPENGQYLRNIMLAADFLQNHIRHFYLFSLPDFVIMPKTPPYHGQDLADMRLSPSQNERLASHMLDGIKAAQESHQILTLFGGKAPHQHSFMHGGVSVHPTADKIMNALALAERIREFVKEKMVPDAELIAKAYSDYFRVGRTPGRLLSFGLWRFGSKNERPVWPAGVFLDGRLSSPDVSLIEEDVTNSWFSEERLEKSAPGGLGSQGRNSPKGAREDLPDLMPDPTKPGAYTWVKSVKYGGQHYEGGPLARMLMLGKYRGGFATMDRIMARCMETECISELVVQWLRQLTPGPPPISQKTRPVRDKATATNDAMRGPLLHRAEISFEDEHVIKYDIITPTAWNFSPKDVLGIRGPVESALVGTVVANENMLPVILGRILRSFDPCMACGTHVFDLDNHTETHLSC